MRILVMGAGSLGTIVGALLSKDGLDVIMADANREHVYALNDKGATITGHLNLNVPVKAVTPDSLEGVFDLVIYLVKATFDEVALPQALEHMGPESMIITLQNGVPEEKVASFIGKERTLGGAVGWGATWIGPGVSELTSDPDDMTYDIGELDGKITDRIRKLEEVLNHAGKAIITENLKGIRWTKLLVNVAMSGLSTVLGCPYGDILDDDKAITAAICIMLETILASKAIGVKMEPMKGVDPVILLDITKENMENTKNLLKMIYAPHRDIRASMLQDIEKGLRCEVEALNGYLQKTAREAGVNVPVNDQVTDLIRQIESGQVEYGFENLNRIEIPDFSIYY